MINRNLVSGLDVVFDLERQRYKKKLVLFQFYFWSLWCFTPRHCPTCSCFCVQEPSPLRRRHRKEGRQPSSFPSSTLLLHFVVKSKHTQFRYYLQQAFGVQSFPPHLKNISLAPNEQHKSFKLDTNKLNIIHDLPPCILLDYSEELSRKKSETSMFFLFSYATSMMIS